MGDGCPPKISPSNRDEVFLDDAEVAEEVLRDDVFTEVMAGTDAASAGIAPTEEEVRRLDDRRGSSDAATCAASLISEDPSRESRSHAEEEAASLVAAEDMLSSPRPGDVYTGVSWGMIFISIYVS